jgi:hypothetical protein
MSRTVSEAIPSSTSRELARLIRIARMGSRLKLERITSERELAITVLSRFTQQTSNGLTSLLSHDRLCIGDRHLLADFIVRFEDRAAANYSPLIALATSIITTYQMAEEVVERLNSADLGDLLRDRPRPDISLWLALVISRAPLPDHEGWLIAKAETFLKMDRRDHP